MFISDFAIKRPIVTIVLMVAHLGLRHLRAAAPEHRRVPRGVAADRRGRRSPIRAPRPTPSSARSSTPIEEQIAAISGVKKIQSNSLDSFGVITVEFDFSKNLQEATQDIRDGISQIRNDLPPEMEEPILTRFDPNDFPIVQLALTSKTLTGAELTRMVDPGDHAAAARRHRRRRGARRRRHRARADRRARAAGAAGRRRQRRRGGAGAAGAEPGLAGRPPQRRDRRAHHPPAGPPRQAGRVHAAGGRAARRPADPPRRHRGWPRTAPRSRAPRPQFNGRDAVGIDIIKADGYSTTAVSDRDPREGRRDPEVAAARRRARGRPRRRAARRPTRSPTSRTRSSKAPR